jgi:RNA recognition motif-containing protein
LLGLFEPFGPVKRAAIAKTEDGVSRGFAFVKYALKEDAEKALQELQGKVLKGRNLKLEIAVKKELPRKKKRDSINDDSITVDDNNNTNTDDNNTTTIVNDNDTKHINKRSRNDYTNKSNDNDNDNDNDNSGINDNIIPNPNPGTALSMQLIVMGINTNTTINNTLNNNTNIYRYSCCFR